MFRVCAHIKFAADNIFKFNHCLKKPKRLVTPCESSRPGLLVAIARLWLLFTCLVFYLDKTNQSNGENVIQIFQTGFDTTLLIGQYFSFGYFWAIVAATLQNKVASFSSSVEATAS